jgi:hypothetical protein
MRKFNVFLITTFIKSTSFKSTTFIKNKMSMATRIDDLPGAEMERSLPVDIERPRAESDYDVEPQRQKRVKFEEPADAYEEQSEEQSLFGKIKNEISEENVVLLILFFVASMPEATRFLENIPYLSEYVSSDSSLVGNLVKAALFLIAFIVIKWTVLPRLNV